MKQNIVRKQNIAYFHRNDTVGYGTKDKLGKVFSITKY